MKKALVLLCVFMIALALPLFADDAITLPAGVLRTYLTAAYAFGNTGFDADGKSQDTGMDVTVVNLGAALEFGVNDWVSAGLRWAPGWNVYTKMDPDPLAFFGADSNMNGPFDLFIGAKIQVIGPKAPVPMDNVRLALTPGVKIPMPGADWEKQQENLPAGDPVTIQDADKHALAFGGDVSFDYVINEMFYVNVFGEYIQYLEIAEASDLFTYPDTYKLAYGYDIKLEAEPHFEMALGGGKLGVGVPFTYTMWPETEMEGTALTDSDGNLLTVGPSASYFFVIGPLPFEVKLGYTLPLMGKNTVAMGTAVFQLKSYLKF
ncbi:MAG: hypothetical protein NT080_08855 [Spirochaetes bacterium]|nr:hypothetical protein [Spirochaetota bacterium]